MHAYFFIPATKFANVDKVKSIGVSTIIIDFEDAVSVYKREQYLSVIKQKENFEEFWYRIPLRNSFNEKLDFNFLEKIIQLGVTNIMIPKLISKIEFIQLINYLKPSINKKFILLIEHPRLLIELKDILQDSSISKNIKAIGLGSHDLLSFMNVSNKTPHLEYARMQILYLANAYNLIPIDIASMNIRNEKEFLEEAYWGQSIGYNDKFCLHPDQYNWLKTMMNIDEDTILWAKKIMKNIPENTNVETIEPFVLEGKIVEKPHIYNAIEILKAK